MILRGGGGEDTIWIESFSPTESFSEWTGRKSQGNPRVEGFASWPTTCGATLRILRLFLAPARRTVYIPPQVDNDVALSDLHGVLRRHQGCMLSPILCSLYTHDCVARPSSNTIVKFADSTVEVGLKFPWECALKSDFQLRKSGESHNHDLEIQDGCSVHQQSVKAVVIYCFISTSVYLCLIKSVIHIVLSNFNLWTWCWCLYVQNAE